MVVEARLDARLLGVKVLRVDGTVLLSPGHLVEPPRAVHQQTTTSAVPRELARGADRVPGGDLARAARLLADNRARLGRPARRPFGQDS